MAKKVRQKAKGKNTPDLNYREESIQTSRPDTRPALIALLLVILLIGSGLYLTSMVEEAPKFSYGFETSLLTDNHKTAPGYATDFVLIIENTGSIADTFDISVKSNDGGFTIEIEEGYESIVVNNGKSKPVIINVKTSSSATGMLYSNLEVKSRGDNTLTSTVKLNVDCDHTFGNQTVTGDTVNAHYAGILASNAQLFDSSMEYIWDNYLNRMSDVSDPRPGRPMEPLNAGNIGCNYDGDPSADCEGSRQMIKGFDNKMVGMYEGQTLAVRIPAAEAYGLDPLGHSLGGQDLIFLIDLVTKE
tara:strand:+ start:1510 stop:2415 length:906 start_codon:yes stop_codon:yes gene_type:complete